MKVLILNWRGPGHPNAGGAEQVTLEHAKKWVKAGHEVFWFTSKFGKSKTREIVDGITIIRLGSQFIDVQVRAFFWYMWPFSPNFDLVIDQFHGIPFLTPLYVKCKKIAFIHEVARDVWKYNPWPKPFNKFPTVIGPVVEKMVFRLYRKIPFMTVSLSTKNDLINFGIPKNHIHIIHNGFIKPNKTFSVEKEKIHTATFLGALATDKGIEDAVKVFSEIERKDDMWQFWIIGKGGAHEMSTIQNLINSLKLENKIKFWGFVNDTKKFQLLAKSHFLINTSYHEGWGLVNIEANSVGTPVLAYDVHGSRDSVKSGVSGMLSPKNDYRDIAFQAVKLVRETGKYLALQKGSLKWSKNFNWEKSTTESLELIESI